MQMKFFDGFYLGQKLQLLEIDQSATFIVEAIIVGGMGVCVKVQNESSHECLALKGIQKELLSDHESIERFRKELNIWYVCASLDGVVDTRGIVMINGIPYMASEWCVGGDLSAHLERMSPSEKIRTFLAVVEALKAVYEKYGIIHRDLKPQNILVNDKRRPLVSDWGLAKIYADRNDIAGNGATMTSADTTAAGMGTLLYMSPEQLRRDPKIDFRSDIYALGCILHEFETGTPPYLGRTVNEIAQRHFSEPPPKLGGIFHRTNLGLEKVILKCLQKKPIDRYQSYGELLQEVAELAKKRGVGDYPHTVARYERVLPGAGYEHIIKKELSSVSQGQGVMLSNEKYLAIREEADMLVANGKFAEAVKLLHPLVNKDNVFGHGLDWHSGAEAMESCAHALIMDKKLDEADKYYKCLSLFSNKPSTFYVNRAYLYLHKNDPARMLEVCKQGLNEFPKDKDLLGNAATAFRLEGDYESSMAALKKSIALGVDVYDYEEMNNLLSAQTELLRYTNLDRFAANMKNRFSAISKGLALNRSFPSLCIAEVEFRCEVYENDGIGACEQLLGNKNVKGSMRDVVLRHWVDAYVEYARFGTPEKIGKAINAFVPYANDESLSLKTRDYIKDAYYWLVLQFVPNVRDDLDGNGKGVMEWFLAKEDGKYRRPLATAEILHKIGRKREAYDLLNQFKDKRNWYANRLWVNLLFCDGEYEKAVMVAKHGTELMPEHREVWNSLYCSYQKIKNSQGANYALSKAKETWAKEQSIIDALRALYTKGS